jgi:hypothetical protein
LLFATVLVSGPVESLMLDATVSNCLTF